jgi:MoaA/NifB/PqqE/SkfB family radical SAM enzyme
MEQVPLKVVWRISQECDHFNGNKCIFCYSPKIKRNNKLNEQKLFEIAATLIRRGVKIVVFTGGEPFMIPCMPGIVKFFSNNGVIVNLSTNGNLLLRKFPEYYKYIDILALPLDGANAETHTLLRKNSDNFQNIINVLEDLKKHRENDKTSIKLKIETVYNSKVDHEIEQIALLINKYEVDIWKIFEYNRYSDRHSAEWDLKELNIKYEIDKIENRVKSRLDKTEVICADSSSRNNRYFIINPNGNVVIPQMKIDLFEDLDIGSLLVESEIDNIIKKWKEEVNITLYNENLKGIYEDIYELNNMIKNKLTLKNKNDIRLWDALNNIGINHVYSSQVDFANFRIYYGRPIMHLYEYLNLANESILVIAHSIGTAAIDQHFIKVIQNKAKEFNGNIKFIFPNPKSVVAEVIGRSKYPNNFDFFKSEIEETANAIFDIKDSLGVNSSKLIVEFTNHLIYGSIVVLDGSIIQIETKFFGVAEKDNFLVEFIKDSKEKYFDKIHEGIDSLANSVDNISFEKYLSMVKTSENNDSTDENEFWNAFSDLCIKLYPKGPMQNGLWKKASGNESHLKNEANGEEKWIDILDKLKNGGCRPLTLKTLFDVIYKDYKGNEDVEKMSEKFINLRKQ